MKLVHISGSTKGELLTDGSQIHIFIGTQPPTEEDVDKVNARGWIEVTEEHVVKKDENGFFYPTGSEEELASGIYRSGSAFVPPFYKTPTHWEKWLLIPNEYNYFKILSTCKECKELNSTTSTYRDMIMTGSFLNDPNL